MGRLLVLGSLVKAAIGAADGATGSRILTTRWSPGEADANDNATPSVMLDVSALAIRRFR
ncbi:MAG TPA: hypothetical protein DCE55_02990 [Planctomycetaceae bacterium]|nr:hypothetical protein [Planctomycetaceae bacterium]